MRQTNYRNVLEGVSTLDKMQKKSVIPVFFIISLTIILCTIFSTNVFGRGGHSTLDLVDPSFNPQVQTNSYGNKWVNAIQALPDGKILAIGGFNTYNRVPTGKLVRLNPDGSLDPTFNNHTISDVQSFEISAQIIVQPDGKIVIRCVGMVVDGQPPKTILRLNADGTYDPTFNYAESGHVYKVEMDSLGRFVLLGNLTTPSGARSIIRLNGDGSLDDSFDFALPANTLLQTFVLQGNKLIVNTEMNGNRIYRLNEDGSTDASFTPQTGTSLTLLAVNPNNKILYQNSLTIMRLNANGGGDSTFQPTTVPEAGPRLLRFTSDGKIVFTIFSTSPTIRRYLADGGLDAGFSQYTAESFASLTVMPDNSLVIGDGTISGNGGFSNNFVKLTSSGDRDPVFNQGGIGFQNILPGIIQAIDPQPDGKVLLGGKFDLINDVARHRLARLNADSTVDPSFQINASGTGNYFSSIREIYQIRAQKDGKIIVSGFFDYVLNGVAKSNLVRLNADGSIDNTFNLTYRIQISTTPAAAQNKFKIYSDGRIMIATSKNGSSDRTGPVRLTPAGALDPSFNSTIYSSSLSVIIDDLAIQPDGKIVIAGSYATSNSLITFVGRLGTDGAADPTFLYTEEPNRMRMDLDLLPNGKILVSKSNDYNGGSARVQRLNSDGSVDASFNQIVLPDTAAQINALLVLPEGKFFIGGIFTITVDGQERRNLLQFSADGNPEPTVYDVNGEVLCLAADSEGRVLVGGKFTIIGSNGENTARSYVARLTDSNPLFDFDGDGRSDLGVFTPSNGTWAIHHSNAGQTLQTIWGLPADKLVAADYDGDDKTDVAVFRPSNGVWYISRSRDGFMAIQWGLAGDKPVAADYDGDGKTDVAVWRPGERSWFIRKSSNGQAIIVQFGLPDDIPLANADYDGDGKSDIAVWRPSNGVFYWLASGSGNQFRAVQFGRTGDVPVVGDFNGDGKTDPVVFRPTEGNWYQYLTAPSESYNFVSFHFGLNGDEPVTDDYDGDGKTDVAVRRGNVWHINRSGQGYTSVAFADANDLAVASSLGR